MSLFTFDFAIIGGDTRFLYLAKFLINEGYKVIVYLLSEENNLVDCPRAESLEEAVSLSRAIIGGIPFIREDYFICHKGNKADMTTANLIDSLKENQILFAGCLKETFIKKCVEKKVRCYDFMKDENITIYNTIATAEGVIAEAIMHCPDNIHGSKSLILGYGKCGKSLAERLKNFNSETTVCTRKTADREWARTNNHKTISFEKLEENIDKYQLIFNTVPHMVFDKKMLQFVNTDSIILDIASYPGGVDFIEAEKLGITAKLYPGLPGKYAPRSSGIILGKYIFKNASAFLQRAARQLC